MNGVYYFDTVTAKYIQFLFLFHRFRPGIFAVKDAPHTDGPMGRNVDKIAEMIRVDRQLAVGTLKTFKTNTPQY